MWQLRLHWVDEGTQQSLRPGRTSGPAGGARHLVWTGQLSENQDLLLHLRRVGRNLCHVECFRNFKISSRVAQEVGTKDLTRSVIRIWCGEKKKKSLSLFEAELKGPLMYKSSFKRIEKILDFPLKEQETALLLQLVCYNTVLWLFFFLPYLLKQTFWQYACSVRGKPFDCVLSRRDAFLSRNNVSWNGEAGGLSSWPLVPRVWWREHEF